MQQVAQLLAMFWYYKTKEHSLVGTPERAKGLELLLKLPSGSPFGLPAVVESTCIEFSELNLDAVLSPSVVFGSKITSVSHICPRDSMMLRVQCWQRLCQSSYTFIWREESCSWYRVAALCLLTDFKLPEVLAPYTRCRVRFHWSVQYFESSRA